MHDPTTPDIEEVTADARGRRTAGLVLVLIVVFIGVAIAKPWESPPASTSQPPAPVGTLGAAVSPSPAPTGTAVPTPVAPTPVVPPIDTFAIALPPPDTAMWSAIHWQRLAPDNPLRLIRSVLRWRGGYIAVGSLASGGATTTPVWTSREGGLWMPVLTFWPGLRGVRVGEVPSGLVALTLLDGSYPCGAPCPTYSSALPLMSWTSPDGRSWTPNPGPNLGLPATWKGPPLLAAGPAGLVAASPTWPTRLARSADGIHWRAVPVGALPSGLDMRDIVGTAAGFTAVGLLPVGADQFRAAAVQSVDGATWTGPYPLALTTASTTTLASTGSSWGATALVRARSGLIAAGQVTGTPGRTLWWQSSNGRNWRTLPSYRPLGPTTCTGEGCGDQPNGVLIGDGTRIMALRGGADAGVWTSTDGLAWRRLPVTGDLPGEQATQAVLLPGDVLVSDGTTYWFGWAVTK